MNTADILLFSKNVFHFRLWLGVLLLFTFISCKAQSAEKSLPANNDDNSLLWQISGKGLTKPSYLFGTFHLICADEIRFSNNLRSAIQRADEVYFEMDLDDPSNTLGALFFMNMKNGQTLDSLYTKEEYARLAKYFSDSVGMSLNMLKKVKPGFLEAFLYPGLLNCKNITGVEQELLKIAQADKKEIKGFETIAMQAAVFDSIPYKEQAESLLETIDSIATYKIFFNNMLEMYKAQKIPKIEKLFSEDDFGMQDNQDIMLDSRNRNWIAQLKKILPSTSVFMAVGAGHLAGVKGLIALLRKEGYIVTPVMNLN